MTASFELTVAMLAPRSIGASSVAVKMRPPIRLRASRILTVWPNFCSWWAAQSPAIPPPVGECVGSVWLAHVWSHQCSTYR